MIDAVGPRTYAVGMSDTDAKAQASDSEVLLVLVAGSYEALKDIVTVDTERILRVVGSLGLKVNLAAATEQTQAELVWLGTSMFFLWRRTVTDPMTILKITHVPDSSGGFHGIKFLLSLFFRDRSNTNGVGELGSVVAMGVIVVIVVLENVHHVATTDKFVDAVFDLLW